MQITVRANFCWHMEMHTVGIWILISCCIDRILCIQTICMHRLEVLTISEGQSLRFLTGSQESFMIENRCHKQSCYCRLLHT